MNTQDISLRTATLSDAEALVRLVESAYRGDSSRAGWTTEADMIGGQRTDLDEIEAILTDPLARFIVAHNNPGPDLVGCILVKQENNATAYIGMVTVSPKLQARGLGRRLLAQAEKVALELFNAREVRMTVIVQREELIRWYARRGFERTDEREPFPYGDTRFGMPNRPDLEFAVLRKRLDKAG